MHTLRFMPETCPWSESLTFLAGFSFQQKNLLESSVALGDHSCRPCCGSLLVYFLVPETQSLDE